MFAPKTISELLEHPDYERLVEAGPRYKAPLRLSRLMPLFIFLAFCGVVASSMVMEDRAADAPRYYAPLALFAFVVAAMLAKVGLRASLSFVPVEVTEVGPMQAEPRGCRLELKAERGPKLDFLAPERIASGLVQGDVGVAFVTGDQLVDLRRLQDLSLSSSTASQ